MIRFLWMVGLVGWVAACGSDVADPVPGEPEAPAEDTVPAEEPADTVEAGDWVDALPLPSWVLDPDEVVTRRYTPPGQAPTRRGPVTPLRPVDPPVLVLRSQGRSVRITSLGDVVGVTEWRAPIQTRLREVGHCTSGLDATGSAGRLSGRLGSWYSRLFSDAGSCQAWTRTLPPVGPQEDPLREEVADHLARLLPEWGDQGGLDEAAVVEFGAGRIIWGVARARRPTRLLPPPPWPQAMFVLRIRSSGESDLLWSEVHSDPDVRVGLAGVLDLTGDRVPEALFTRQSDGGWEVLMVGTSDDGFGVVGRHFVARGR